MHVVNKYFQELTSANKFTDFVTKLWQKVIEVFEPRLGRLEGIRHMVESLEKTEAP